MELILSGNSIGDDSATLLLNVFKDNAPLADLDVHDTGVSVSIVLAIDEIGEAKKAGNQSALRPNDSPAPVPAGEQFA
jgi:hypothetical protein